MAYAGRRGVTLPVNPWLIGAAAAYALLCMLMLAPWRSLPGLAGAKLVPHDVLGMFSKTRMPTQRLLSILALAYLVAALVRPDARWLGSRAARLVGDCGRNSLVIFCLGTLLSFAGFVVLLEAGREWYFQVAVNAVGLGALVAVAWFLSQRKSMVRGTRVAAVVRA